MKIAVVQLNMAWEDRRGSRERITSLFNSNKLEADVDWLIFPEMTLTGFTMNQEEATIDQEGIDFFQNLAIELNVYITYGGVSNQNNCAITLDRYGRIISNYAKIHLFSYAGENDHYKAGHSHASFILDDARITPMICYDLRFSYLFWEKAVSTDIYVVIASWPAVRILHWRSLLQARAIENQAFVIGVNRVGKDTKLDYNGNSLVVDPLGSVILDCPDNEGIFVAEFDLDKVAQTRLNYPFAKDRKSPASWEKQLC